MRPARLAQPWSGARRGRFWAWLSRSLLPRPARDRAARPLSAKLVNHPLSALLLLTTAALTTATLELTATLEGQVGDVHADFERSKMAKVCPQLPASRSTPETMSRRGLVYAAAPAARH